MSMAVARPMPLYADIIENSKNHLESLRRMRAIRLLLREYGVLITPLQIRILMEVKRDPGISVGEIASAMNFGLAQVSNNIGRLIKRDLLITRKMSTDRRVVNVMLTEGGENVLSVVMGK